MAVSYSKAVVVHTGRIVAVVEDIHERAAEAALGILGFGRTDGRWTIRIADRVVADGFVKAEISPSAVDMSLTLRADLSPETEARILQEFRGLCEGVDAKVWEYSHLLYQADLHESAVADRLLRSSIGQTPDWVEFGGYPDRTLWGLISETYTAVQRVANELQNSLASNSNDLEALQERTIYGMFEDLTARLDDLHARVQTLEARRWPWHR